MPAGLSGEKALQKAYRLLAMRAHSEAELASKLRRGGFAASAVGYALARCREQGYLDDEKYARQRARELAVNRLAGNRRIALDLREKGIPQPLVDGAIAEARRELGQEEALDRLLERMMRGEEIAGRDDRRKARWVRSLLGRGFPAGLIVQRLNMSEEDGLHDDDGQ
jgi:regulatory protein